MIVTLAISPVRKISNTDSETKSAFYFEDAAVDSVNNTATEVGKHTKSSVDNGALIILDPRGVSSNLWTTRSV
jgi:hypothetical protein